MIGRQGGGFYRDWRCILPKCGVYLIFWKSCVGGGSPRTADRAPRDDRSRTNLGYQQSQRRDDLGGCLASAGCIQASPSRIEPLIARPATSASHGWRPKAARGAGVERAFLGDYLEAAPRPAARRLGRADCDVPLFALANAGVRLNADAKMHVPGARARDGRCCGRIGGRHGGGHHRVHLDRGPRGASHRYRPAPAGRTSSGPAPWPVWASPCPYSSPASPSLTANSRPPPTSASPSPRPPPRLPGHCCPQEKGIPREPTVAGKRGARRILMATSPRSCRRPHATSAHNPEATASPARSSGFRQPSRSQ